MCVNTENCHCEINDWVGEMLKRENLSKYNVIVNGTSEKGDGYLGDIKFVHVWGNESDGNVREFDLVIKHGKKNEDLRQKLPVRLAFQREIFVYTRVMPTFQTFLMEKGLSFQNLKKIGYELHDRRIPMDLEHLRHTLGVYGQWHAMSLALKDQNAEQFEKLGRLGCVWKAFSKNKEFQDMIVGTENVFRSILEERNEIELLRKFKEMIKPSIWDVWQELLQVDEERSVISHGDCWNNNFMFKYRVEDRLQPTKVSLLDFQLSRLASPVFDLSYHLYLVCSEEELRDFTKLLRIYHKSLSHHLRHLGSDSDKLFPFSTLIDHWKKYSLFGLILSGTVLPLTTSDKEDTLNIEDLDGDSISNLLTKFAGSSKTNLENRIVAIARHAVEFEF
ncbi:uncharacterized protein LOC132697021 isoform X2 [Cylas formicarius]|uniref:uncharacterized protein LOC132697021 isoform X2 n=1 Tax=Cylas formicarius TaxID=197179 RepID=UPI00295883EB|nr:uncharacterized protein LOC132697021 isoform X2 [Cylas formicarius]